MAFRFKQFEVEDSNSSMKVGTDAVLLGALAEGKGESRDMLEIGTGCGLISLMMAQRFQHLQIEAIDIDPESCNQAVENVRRSKWENRIEIRQQSLQQLARESEKQYELILSNPPFFENSLKPANPRYHLSKHSKQLTHAELLAGIEKLLKKEGAFWVILPANTSKRFRETAFIHNLFITKSIRVFPKSNKAFNRIILKIQKTALPETASELLIHNSDNTYTEEYMALTADFYL
ncbi:MAG: methyltransferase [Bacteroidales bacterium]|nr:methyltransferase [Bacteroidales bacterium]MCF8352742.1 methyltransferase [Bacteroidales bacterium]MCF8375412.1 methyltransferase [Bacteroidales bacterium]MCF8400960.1 methyltransferase [Bacteroidales bacterium]